MSNEDKTTCLICKAVKENHTLYLNHTCILMKCPICFGWMIAFCEHNENPNELDLNRLASLSYNFFPHKIWIENNCNFKNHWQRHIV